MNRWPRLLWLQVLLGVLTTFAVPSTGGEIHRPVSWEHYRVLSERNIFVRDRRRPRENQSAPDQPAGIINTDKYLVLTGIGHQGREGIAFVEDTRSGETIRIRTGDPIGNGRIVRITLDYAEYECKENTIRIGIGSSLVGLTVSYAPAASAGAGQSGDAPGSDTSAILERMRKRREQETNR